MIISGDRSINQVEIIVWDTGLGIKEDDLPALFQPFFQVDASLSRQYEGLGLGLAITRKLVELLGGQIVASSTYGKGSRFIITLPWKEP